jgi:hypothetical protein
MSYNSGKSKSGVWSSKVMRESQNNSGCIIKNLIVLFYKSSYNFSYLQKARNNLQS